MDECHQVTGGSSSKLLLMNYLSLPLHQQASIKIIGLTSTDLKMLSEVKLSLIRFPSIFNKCVSLSVSFGAAGCNTRNVPMHVSGDEKFACLGMYGSHLTIFFSYIRN